MKKIEFSLCLGCPFCRRTVDHNDLGNLRLRKEEIQSIQVYQQSRLFEMEHSNYIERSRANEVKFSCTEKKQNVKTNCLFLLFS